jgi:NSS family neurotransmitter:Na+ symporter
MANVTKQQTWSKEAGYIWSMIGSAVGFANVLSFSALCYKNGGGAFLIPYIIAHLVIGLPMLILEGIIGQRTKLPIVTAMGNVAGSLGKMVGWLAVLTCATIGGFYVVLTGYSVAYTYFSATGSIGADSAFFFKHVFLKDSGSLAQLGGIAVGVLISTALVVIFTWSVIVRNVHSGIEKMCSFFMPLLGMIVILFSVAAFFLPGSIEGIRHYLIPNFSRLGDWLLWRDVFGQVFFSLSLGLGIVVGYSRHNPSSFNVPRAMLKVAIGDFVISFIAGFAIFGCIGFMSAKSGIPFSQLVPSDSAFEIGFVIFPTILAQFGQVVSKIVGPIFFFCVFIAGVTGFFSIVESVAGNIEVEFNKSRKRAVAIAMIFVGALALPFCMGNGQHILGSLAPMVLGNAMLIGGIAEIILFLMISKTIGNDKVWMKGANSSFSYYALKYGVLPILTLILFGALYQEASKGVTTEGILRFSWLAIVLLSGGMLTYRRSSQKAVNALHDNTET